MKVLFLVSGIGPPAGWGTEFIQELIFNLSKKGTKATIINPIYKHTHPDWKQWTKEQEKKYKVRIISLDAPKLIKKSLIFHLIITPFFVTFFVIKFLSKEKFDFVHEFSSTPIILLRALIFKLLFKIPTVFTLSVLNTTFLGSLNWFRVFNFGKAYLIPSKEIMQSLKRLGIQDDKIYFIPPAIDLKKFYKIIGKQQARNKLNLPSDKYIISYFGSLTTEKGIEDIIAAAQRFTKLLAEKCHIEMVVIWKGSNEHRQLAQKINTLKLPFLELRQEYIDIPALLSASDCILLPQQSGHGTTIPPIATIETLASGKPIITTNIIGNRDWVKNNNGILIEPKSPNSIVKAIEKIINLNIKKNNNYLKVFEVENVVKKYLEVYKLSGLLN